MKKLLIILAFLALSSSSVVAQSATAPPNGMTEIQAYSIFYENYKNESYENALEFGRWIWKGMPEKIEGYSRFDLKRNLDRLVTVYTNVAEQKQDPSLKEAYIDTALSIYDKMFEKYDSESDHYVWYISRGRLYQEHSSVLDSAMVKASQNYYQAYQLRPKEFVNYGDGYYMQVMLQEMVVQEKKDQVLAIMKKAEPHASEQLKSYFNDVRNRLFDSPKERITFLEQRVQDNPKNEEALKSLRDLYQQQEMMQKAREISQKLYELNPSYENIMALADFAINNANYDEAIKYLKEGLQKAKTDKQKAEISLKISNAYLNQDQVQAARRYARQAIDYDSDWGQPYIQIADIYARAVSVCTNNRKMDRRDKTVYWLVLDYLDKARQVDPNTANEVKRKYQSYSSVIPTDEEKFFWDPPLNKGDEFRIDSSLRECYGWINETTTVR